MNGFVNGINPMSHMNTGGPALDHQQSGYMRNLAGTSHSDQTDMRMTQVNANGMTPTTGMARPMAQGPMPSLLSHQQAMLMRQQQGQRPTQQPPLTAPTDGGPPYKVPLHPLFTRVQQLEPGQPFPSIEAADQRRVKQWMERDLAYEAELAVARRGKRVEQGQIQQDVLMREDWLGGVDRASPGRLKIKFEETKGKRGLHRKGINMSKQQLKDIARKGESIIPVRLECEHEVYKLRDTFTWNLRETIVTPEIFASHLCDDMRLPYQGFYKEIVTQLRRHIEDAQLNENYTGHLGDDLSTVKRRNRDWYHRNITSRLESSRVDLDVQSTEDDDDTSNLNPTHVNEELRVLIRLDITLDSVQLVDKFEWDISNPNNSPEEFAETFAADLGLSGEFKTAIAHSIREQVDIYTRSLCIIDFVPGVPIPDEDLRREFLPPLSETFRPEAEDFTPLLNHLTAEEVDRNEKEREREARRKRRQTKGRGVTLPDRDFNKTHRSLVPRSSHAPVVSYQDSRGDTVYPLPELSQPYPIVMPTPLEKPADLETFTSSPLRLVPVKSANANVPPAYPGVAGDKAGRKRKFNADGTVDMSGNVTPGEKGSPAPGDGGSKRGPKARKIGKNLEALGLHEHIINGEWHCANCGVPGVVAIGRRKGPSGMNTLCGLCGKFYHRYKKMRPCTYTIDLETHMTLRAEAEAAKAVKESAGSGTGGNETSTGDRNDSDKDTVQRSGSARPKRAIPDTSDDEDSDDSDVSMPRRRRPRGQSPDLPFVQIGTPDSDNSSSSSDEAPLRAVAPVTRAPVTVQPPNPAPVPARAAPEPLPWMVQAASELRAKQLDDRFEIIPRPRPPDPNVQEWRIRCLDCPGKLYNLGPDETLTGFQVHFKNKQHRANVEARLKSGSAQSM